MAGYVKHWSRKIEYEDRKNIESLLNDRLSLRKIAKKLDLSYYLVRMEVSNNGGVRKYSANAAEEALKKRLRNRLVERR